jgi:hypothetical protein
MGLGSLLLADFVGAASLLPGPTDWLQGPVVAASIGAVVCALAALVHLGRAHSHTGTYGRVFWLAVGLLLELVVVFFAEWSWPMIRRW